MNRANKAQTYKPLTRPKKIYCSVCGEQILTQRYVKLYSMNNFNEPYVGYVHFNCMSAEDQTTLLREAEEKAELLPDNLHHHETLSGSTSTATKH